MAIFPTEKIEKLFQDNKPVEAREEMKKWLLEESGSGEESILDILQSYAQLQSKYAEEHLEEMEDLKNIMGIIKDAKNQVNELEAGDKIKNKIKDL